MSKHSTKHTTLEEIRNGRRTVEALAVEYQEWKSKEEEIEKSIEVMEAERYME